MILTFSTDTQKILAAHDDGQMVISYIDSRIRNVGLGLYGCKTPQKIAEAFGIKSDSTNVNFKALKIKKNGSTGDYIPLDLPLAITSGEFENEVVDSQDGVYRGNILTIMYAHKDYNIDNADNKDTFVLLGAGNITSGEPRKVIQSSADQYKFNIVNVGHSPSTKFDLGFKKDSNRLKKIESWAALEASGLPVRVSNLVETSDSVYSLKENGKIYLTAPYVPIDVYPMSELLNLECQKLYAATDTPNASKAFIYANISQYGGSWEKHYHTKNILDLYMTLDTKHNPPIFDLKVLVSEGKNNHGDTQRPINWPGFWKDEYSQHKVHVSQASWKLYNLAPLYHH